MKLPSVQRQQGQCHRPFRLCKTKHTTPPRSHLPIFTTCLFAHDRSFTSNVWFIDGETQKTKDLRNTEGVPIKTEQGHPERYLLLLF